MSKEKVLGAKTDETVVETETAIETPTVEVVDDGDAVAKSPTKKELIQKLAEAEKKLEVLGNKQIGRGEIKDKHVIKSKTGFKMTINFHEPRKKRGK